MTLPNKPPTRDHIRPRRRGGSNVDLRNRAIVCMPCNVDKGDRSLASFLMRLERAGDPRAVHVAAFMDDRAGSAQAVHGNPRRQV